MFHVGSHFERCILIYLCLFLFRAGVIVVGRASFAEVCDDTNQAIGVSLVFAAWNSAIVLGPALGGTIPTFIK